MFRSILLGCGLFLGCMTSSLQLEAALGAVNPSTNDLPPQEVKVQEPHDPLAELDILISATEKSLQEQKTLRRQIDEYQQLRDQYMQNKRDRQLGMRLVKVARTVLQGVENYHLTRSFDQETLEELRSFSKIGSKKGIPRPR